MEKLVIEGGTSLKGEVFISGSKNSSLPILFASILVPSEVVLKNVPDLRDIHTAIKLLSILGCKAEYQNNQVMIDSSSSLNETAPYDLVRTMRASILCLGPLLARRGKAKVALPGGCAIGIRPVDLHLMALRRMGAEITVEEGYIIAECRKLKGTHIVFDFPTVGGTENTLMAAVLAEGVTVIENAAKEPEIVDLANFLIKCGAKIRGHGSSIIEIEGVESLKGCEYEVMADRIEAGTFLAASAITKGDIVIKNCPVYCMDSVLFKFREMGLGVDILSEDVVHAYYKEPLNSVDIVTQPYPGFPTDMQAQFMAVSCTAYGTSTIKETIFENRFMHALELMRMGASIKLKGDTAIVNGPVSLKGAPVMASDLRASASLVLAGLAAKGKTEVNRIYHLDRGYERLDEKLKLLGAKIVREKV